MTTELELAARRATKPVHMLNELLRHPVDDPRCWAKTAREAHEAVSVLWSLAESAARRTRKTRGAAIALP